MKNRASLQKAQRQMRKRQRQPGRGGRPRLPISRHELLELWARGYSSRGMAIHFGCDERTIISRLAEFFPAGLSLPVFPDSLLYRLAMTSDNPKFLIAFFRRHERR